MSEEENKIPEFKDAPYLAQYLKLVEETESPRLYHVWCALSGISACLGRRCYMPFGHFRIYPNMFVLLVGNPGTRKSSALKIMTKLVKDATNVRFAPQDTAGQRQGLFTAMQGAELDKEISENLDYEMSDTTLSAIGKKNGITLDDLGGMSLDEFAEVRYKPIDDADRHAMYVSSEEFSRFIGQNNLQMLDFLVTMWDGDDFSYRIKNEEIILENPLLNLIGCTTPTSIASSMPVQAVGQGFMSRVILVHGQGKFKSLAWPKIPPKASVVLIKRTLERATNMHGAFDVTQEARDYAEKLYVEKLEIVDSRFIYYQERRQTHLLKLTMAIAASSGLQTITVPHLELAHRLLRVTEKGMPDALGQFGMAKLGLVKQNILEFLRNHATPVPLKTIIAQHHKDASVSEINHLIEDLMQADEVVFTQNDDGSRSVVAKRNASLEKRDKKNKVSNIIESFLTEI